MQVLRTLCCTPATDISLCDIAAPLCCENVLKSFVQKHCRWCWPWAGTDFCSPLLAQPVMCCVGGACHAAAVRSFPLRLLLPSANKPTVCFVDGVDRVPALMSVSLDIAAD